MPRRYPLFAAAALVVVALDQVTKAWARSGLSGRALVRVIGDAFTLQLACNPSNAFHLFPVMGGTRILLSVLGVGAAAAIVVFLWRAGERGTVFPVALGLLFGGAIGNAIDRIAAGCVTDFIVWRAGRFVWPAFNVADAALVVGVFAMAILGWRTHPEERA